MSIKVGHMILPGVRVDETDPLPKFRRMSGFKLFSTKGFFPDSVKADLGACTRTMPYRVQDRYTSDRKPVELKTVVMENEYLKAVFTPEFGGKLWSLYDKERDRDLLMANPVLQPRNLAIRNAWTSGGIEWNFGSLGHSCLTCDNVFCAISEKDGESFVRFYEFDRAKECVFQMDFLLPEGSKCLYSHVKVTNPNNSDTTTYWWTNVAVPEDGKTRVLSSSEMVVVACRDELTYEKLPYLSVMEGDLSYPHNASRSFDYFFQPDEGVKTTWEGAVNGEGFAFFDRSTSPLVYHKMFCWGNHRGGKRWQQYLSDDVHGDYIELQAGFARSQMHDKLFPANSSMEWTQCFGGVWVSPKTIHDTELHSANVTFGKAIDDVITEESLIEADEKMKSLASIKIREEELVHLGSGWGALETMREKKVGDIQLPDNLCFPKSSLSEEQAPWIELLESGSMRESDSVIPVSWMTSEKWLRLLKKSIDEGKSDSSTAYLHLGNMLFEYWDDSHTVQDAISWNESKKYEKMAEQAWKKSDELRPNVFAKRNLAVLNSLRDNNDEAEKYYDELFDLPEATTDFSFASEYMKFLNKTGKYEKTMTLFNRLPDDIRSNDRVMICFAVSALKLDKPELINNFFDLDFAAIREGETSLTDLWFEYHARLLAKKRGIPYGENEKELLAEAENNCPPPHKIDFRMTYDKRVQYRSTE